VFIGTFSADVENADFIAVSSRWFHG